MEAEQRRQRSEGFFACDRHVGLDVGQHGRLEEAVAECVALAAQQQARAFRQRVGDVLLDFHDGLFLDQRSLVDARLDAIAHLEFAYRRHQLLREFLVDAVLHIDTVGADAGLAGVAVFGGNRALDRGIHVRIVEHDEGGVAAQFQRYFLDRRRALLHQQAAHGGRTRKAQLAHEGVACHFAADGFRVAGDDAEHAARDARALGQHGQRQRRERRQLCGFQDNRAAGGQRRRDFSRDHRRRKIPRRDRGADADRFLGHDDAAVRPRRGQRIAGNALGLFAEPLEEGGRIGDLAFRLLQGLALFGRHQERQVVGVFQHQVVPLAQDETAFARGFPAPGRPGGIGGLDRVPRFPRPHVRHAAQLVSSGRVDHVDAGAVLSIAPRAIDVSLLAQQAGVVQIQHRILVMSVWPTDMVDLFGDAPRPSGAP